MNYFMYIWYDLTIVTRVILCIFYIHPELRYLWIAKVMDAITVLESQHSQAGLHGQDNEDGQDGQDCKMVKVVKMIKMDKMVRMDKMVKMVETFNMSIAKLDNMVTSFAHETYAII